MKIYVCHSRNFDYINELYKPLKESHLPIEFIFPHEESMKTFNSKELLESHSCDYVLAEVSYPSTSQGIELGWADVFGIPIICLYKVGADPAKSLSKVSQKIIEYSDDMDLVNKLTIEFGLHIA